MISLLNWLGLRRPLEARWLVNRHLTSCLIILDMRQRSIDIWHHVWLFWIWDRGWRLDFNLRIIGRSSLEWVSWEVITRRPPPRPTLPGSITVGRYVIDSSMGHAVASPLGRPYPMGTVSTSVVLPTTSVLSGDHWLATRRPRPLPAPLLGGNQGRWPLWVSSSSVSSMTSKWPWPLLTGKTVNVLLTCFYFYIIIGLELSVLTVSVLLYLFIYFNFDRFTYLPLYLLDWYLRFSAVFILCYFISDRCFE